MLGTSEMMAQALRQPGQLDLASFVNPTIQPGQPQQVQGPGAVPPGPPTQMPGGPQLAGPQIPYEQIIAALREIPNIDFGAGESDLPTSGPSLPAPDYGTGDGGGDGGGTPYDPVTPDIPNQQPAPAPSQPSGPTGGFWAWSGGEYDPFMEDMSPGQAVWVPEGTQLGRNSGLYRYNPEDRMVQQGQYWSPVDQQGIIHTSLYSKSGDDYVSSWDGGRYRYDLDKGYAVPR